MEQALIEKTGVVAAVMAAVSTYMVEEGGRRGISMSVRPSRWQQWGREEIMRMRSLWQRRLCQTSAWLHKSA